MQSVSSDSNLKRVFSGPQQQQEDDSTPWVDSSSSREGLSDGQKTNHIPTTFNLNRLQHISFKQKYIDPNIGLLFLAGAYLFNSSMVVSTKVLEGDPHEETTIKPLQILLVRMTITYLGTLVYMYMYRNTIPCIPFGEPHMRKWLALRGFLGFISVFGTYFSLMYISISDAVLITFLEPSLIIILAWLILKERVQKMEFVGCLVSFIGVILIVRPPFLFGSSTTVDTGVESNNPAEKLFAALVALLGAFAMAGVYIVIRYLGNQVDAIMNVSYFALVTVIVSLVGIIMIPSMKFQIPRTFKEWTLFINLGISGFCLQLLLTLGIQRERAGRGSLVTYTQLIYSIFWDAVLYKHFPSTWSGCGMFLIIGSTMYVLGLRSDNEPTEEPQGLPQYEEVYPRSSNDIPLQNVSHK